MACAQIDWDNFRFQSQEYRFAVMKSLDVSDEFKDFLYGRVMNGERITRADLWAYGVHNDYWPLFVHEVTTPTNIQDRLNIMRNGYQENLMTNPSSGQKRESIPKNVVQTV